MPKKSIFSWDPETYTVQALESIARGANRDDWAAIKAEYTRLRDIAHKRITRLGESEFKKTTAYTSHVKRVRYIDPETGKTKYIKKDTFPKLRDLDPQNIPAAMAEMVKFLQAKTSTVGGQRSRKSKTIAAWKKQGLDLNEKNYDKVMDLLKEMRTRKLLFGSDKVIDVVTVSMQKGWNFNKVLKASTLGKMLANSDKLGKIPKKAGERLDEYVRRETGW